MRGRKPKPSYLKVIEGNPGKRPLNDDEPEPEGDLSDAPDWFNDEQRARWQYAIACAPQGLLKRLDRSVLTVYVVAEVVHRDAAEKIARYGSVIKTKSGVAMQSPFVGIMNKQAAIMLKAAAEMGFTPSSRSRVQVKGGGPRRGNRFEGLRELGDD